MASTLLALHLNVVPPTSPSPSSLWLTRLWRSNTIHQLRIQLRWALFVLVAPELLVSLSYGDWRAASEGTRLFRKLGKQSIRNWRQLHANFANIGGLYVTVTKSEVELPYITNLIAGFQMNRISTCLKEVERPLNRITTYTSGNHWQLVFKSWIAVFNIALPLLRRSPTTGQTDLPRRTGEHTETNEMTEQSFDVEHDDFAQHVLSELSRERRAKAGDNEGPSSSDRCLSPTPNHIESGPSINRIQDSNSGNAVTLNSILTVHDVYNKFESEKQQLRLSLPAEGHRKTENLYLNSRQIVAAQMLEIIQDIPDRELSRADIQDKSKANGLLKISAMVPLIWFTARVITKRCLQQKISKLELSSSTYIACCVMAYGFSWSKPQGVERPKEYCVDISDQVRPMTKQDLEHLKTLSGSEFISRNFLPPFGMDSKRVELTQPIPTGTSLTSFASFGDVAFFDDDFAGILCGLLIGCLYLLGWDSALSLSLLERVAWRSAVIAIISSLIPYSVANGICTVAFNGIGSPGEKGKTHIIHNLSLYSLLGIYVGGRLYMLGAMIQEFFAEEP